MPRLHTQSFDLLPHAQPLTPYAATTTTPSCCPSPTTAKHTQATSQAPDPHNPHSRNLASPKRALQSSLSPPPSPPGPHKCWKGDISKITNFWVDLNTGEAAWGAGNILSACCLAAGLRNTRTRRCARARVRVCVTYLHPQIASTTTWCAPAAPWRALNACMRLPCVF